uniref:CSON014018 protein n=1 Tax=Culicoides sonorensis TaxID=179676 RepID=A0A336KP51_CULSO
MEEPPSSSSDICRICLKEDETVVNCMEEWLEIIEVISQVKMTLDEDCPEKICNECMNQLIAANEIRNLIIQSTSYFLKREVIVIDEENHAKIVEDFAEVEDVFIEDSNSIELFQEEEENEKSQIYRCCICDESYTDEEELRSHCSELHNTEINGRENDEASFYCFVCKRNFPTFDANTRHRTCGDCGKHFATSESHLVHSMKKNCTENTSNNQMKSLIPSQKTKTSKQFGCCKCSDVFSTHDACKSHFDSNHADEIFEGTLQGINTCKLCLTPFFSKTDLQKHLKIPRMKSYVCDQCNEQMSSFPKYKQHMETVHNDTQEFRCDECEKVYDRLESLRYHKYMHHNEKNNRLCPDCGKVFKKKISFIEHRNIHLGLRPHVCKLCQNSFTSTGALRTHMRSHTGAKPFKCKFCPKRYSHYSDMKRHSYSHTGDYPFVCETCKKGFAKRSALTCHVATHANNR